MKNKPEKLFRKPFFNKLLIIIGVLISVILICFILYSKNIIQFESLDLSEKQFNGPGPVERQVKYYDYEGCLNIEDKLLEEECIINKALRENNKNLCLELSTSQQQERCRKLLLGRKFMDSPEKFDCSILYDKLPVAIQSCELYKNRKLQGLLIDCEKFKDDGLRKLCSDVNVN